MIDFVHAESKRLNLAKSVRRRFSHHQHRWRQKENLRHMIILIKIIYAIIFICLTISTCLDQYVNEENKDSKSIFIRIWNIWYSFLALILLLSLLIDHLKRQNIISLESINVIHMLLVSAFIIFIILGHIQGFYHLWWLSSLSSNQSTRPTFVSIVFIDICPISITIIMTIDLLKKRRSWRHVHINTIISNV
ncbi:unnamed protein product [Rotaria sordida]|uniref:Uncharacterized protein n=1 Tax=Rotaria sordida TaxID=392033 RepID=A0A815LRG4_9BILA|nr:unnamed protein product [Rotaria sordida]CAF1412926.1 unnamed protein product [Rotaria sordida]